MEFIRDYGLILIFFILPLIFVIQPLFLQKIEEKDESEEQEMDEKYDEALAIVAKDRQASISYIQRRLRIGYNRAARIIETMEREGIVGPSDGVKPREVYVSPIEIE